MRFEEFLNERKYLLNVSHQTLVYYKCAFKNWEKHSGDGKPLTWIKNLLDSGVKAVSVNTYICAMNAYWRWSGEYNPVTREGKHIKYIKEEHKVLATLTPEHVKRIINFKPKGANQTRAWLVAMVILDCGLRISEVLGIRRQDLDFDNLHIKVKGKGNKERLVPMSFELRKSLYPHVREKPGLVFGTNVGTSVTIRNFHRDLKALCKKLNITGVRCSPHTLRHTFAIGYLRNGGNLFYLSKILGHTSVKTTETYLQSVRIEDLQAVHGRLSLLAR